MRLRAIVFAVVALGGAGAAAWKLGEAGTAVFEHSTGARVEEALTAAGQSWAGTAVDGLELTLSGAAPDETSRFRALQIARQVVPEHRIADLTTVRAAEALAPPPFALELLRNEGEVSLIGLVPQADARDTIRAALEAGGLAAGVTDMLETADQPAPPGWSDSLGFGLELLEMMPRAKIGVEPGGVRVVAVAETDAERETLEARLAAAAPRGVELTLELSAPRPVIAPFAVAFALADGAGRLEACSAESQEDADAILAAARASGLEGAASCDMGLGAPSPDWAQAVTRGLAALRELGGGEFEIRDTTAVLAGPPGGAPSELAAVGARLDADLPAVFALSLVAPPGRGPATGGGAPAPRFDAELSADGMVRLSGPVQDATSRAAIESYAAALFGHDRVTDATAIDPDLPEGWPRRVLAGVEALAALKQGRLTVTPEAVSLRGSAIVADTDGRLETLLAAKLGDAATVDVRFDAAAAAAVAAASRSKPEACADQIAAILDAGSINFHQGSAEIDPSSRGVVAAIADVLRACPGAAFEIGGHTDADGAAEANQRLSEARARAVQAALETRDLPLILLTARGYGATRPLGDNGTDAGRASNRRIAFRLISPEAALAAEEASATASAGETCAAEVASVLEGGSIEFDPGSATIAATSRGAIDGIVAALRGCPGAAFEIGGYTDSEGDAAANERLSEDRAEAVRAALATEDLAVALTARGHGEARPIADNGSAEGRARNRRIAFTLLGPDTPAAPQTAIDAAPGRVAAPDWDAADQACGAEVAKILQAGSIRFTFGSVRIEPGSGEVIDALAAALRGCPGTAFEIGGHTDSQGDAAANQRLSERRAEAVRAALEVEDLEVTLSARGYGEEAPIADNDTEEGRARNRRIALTLLAPVAEGSDDPGAAGDDPS